MEMNYVGKLQEIMVKSGIKPVYEWIENKSGTHINKFKICLTCQAIPGGPTNIVYGEGLSKKTAKQAAALIFLQKYLNECNNNNNNDKNCNSVSTQVQKEINCVINVKSVNRTILLQMICAKFGFEKPEYADVLQAGPPHSPSFTVACKVSYFRTEGKGTKKSEARLDATTKMIELLMEAQKIYEIFESAQLNLPNNNSNNNNNNNNSEIVCFSDNITGHRIPNLIGIFGRKLRSVSPESEIRVTSPKSTLALMEIKKNDVRENDEKAGNSVCRMLIKGTSNDGFETEVVLRKEKSKSLNNLFYRVENEGSSSSSSEDLPRKSNHFQTINKIDKALENVENQLYEEIRDTLEQRHAKVQKKITILYNEFDVFINDGPHAKITDGCNVCTDKSIIIACLSKLLMDLKEHVANNY